MALEASVSTALGKGDAAKAVRDAEAATRLLPGDAGMRALLGRAYLSAGRFRSADGAFADALTLDPGMSRALVSRVLAQIALGEADAARASLAKAERVAPPADIGLAQALLGDLEGARRRLDTAARIPGADARTRQNLGLVDALAGRWVDAVAIAQQDVPPDQMPQRMHRWAMIAQMKSDPAMQIGAILGVLPAADPGQPAELALAAPTPGPPAVAAPAASARAASAPAPAPTPALAALPPPAALPIVAPVRPVVHLENEAVTTSIFPAPPPLEVLAVKPAVSPLPPSELHASMPEALLAVVPPAVPAPSAPVLAAARVPVSETRAVPSPRPPHMRDVRPSPVRSAAAASQPLKPEVPGSAMIAVADKAKPAILLASRVAMKTAPAKAMGSWAVQFGAFSTLGRREIAWGRLSARAAFLSAYTPTGSDHRFGKATLYRLSVSGLPTRAEAISLCLRVRAAGGACFVRNMRGDEPMRWALKKADDSIKLAVS